MGVANLPLLFSDFIYLFIYFFERNKNKIVHTRPPTEFFEQTLLYKYTFFNITYKH